MSGPKSSRYRLTPEQRRILQEELKRRREAERERKRAEAEKQRRKELLQEINAMTEKLSAQTERLAFLQKEAGYGTETAERTGRVTERAKRQLAELKTEKAETSAALKEQNEKIAGVLREMAAQYAACADQISGETDRFQADLNSRIAGGFHLSFANLGAEKRRKNGERIGRINGALAKLSGLTLSPQLRARLQEISARADAITDPEFLGNFHAVVVVPFIRECGAYESLRKEHDDLLVRYAVLAEECGAETKPVPYTEEGLEFLRAEIAGLEEMSMEQAERAYIRKALDEAMREIGYELAGDRVVSRKSGRRIRHELYSMPDGTAVDVTYGEDGQITMELGGIDQTDREPDPEETAQLVEDMKSFCEDYGALSARLAEKGVTARKIKVYPPAPEYAQIFNSGDYNLTRPVSRYSVTGRGNESAAAMQKET